MASELHERMLAVAGERTYRSIAELTKTNAETVRRYLQGQAPSVEFLASLCAAFGINGEWLLCGRGPMRAEDTRAEALKEASGAELMTAMANAVHCLAERVERLEVYMQTMEVRMRAREAAASGGGSMNGAATGAGGGDGADAIAIARRKAGAVGDAGGANGTMIDGTESTDERATTSAVHPRGDGTSSVAATITERARRIAGAVAKRSHPDAG